ncbi:MAG: AAA family ATPase [Vicinamibacterales bacterium]|jgi:DNA polymerase-3 subunit delta'|nr:AAA family ATPase [Vicinamibacterales bacterium]
MTLVDVEGHVPIRRLIARAVARDTLPPSLMLTGPDGVGKRRVAVAIAKMLNCEAGTAPGADGPAASPDACGVCAACDRIARCVHTDVIIIEPGETGSIKVDAVRAAVDQTAFRPFEGRRRVVIVDDADRLVSEAQNALLKTLEEPPAASVFLLVTSRPHLLLATVRSRCPELRFGGLGTDEIADLLVTRHQFDATAALAAAASADGSVARALETGSGDYIEARQSAADLLRAFATASSPKRRLETGKELASVRRGSRSSAAADRETLTGRLRALGTLLRDLQLVSARGDRAWLANGDCEAELAELAPAYDTDRARRGFASVERAISALSRNASPKVVVDWLALQL